MVKGRDPYRSFAIVHDFDQEPVCRREWVIGALKATLECCEQLRIGSLGMQVLGSRFGPVHEQWFVAQIQAMPAETPPHTLERICLMLPTGGADR